MIGVSEGAGLSVLAASDPRMKTEIAGVIGLGLSDINELGWHWEDAVIYLTHGVPHEPTFSVAAIVDRMAPVPLGAAACVDGNEAAARVAYAFSEVIPIYLITPSSPTAEPADVVARRAPVTSAVVPGVRVDRPYSDAPAGGTLDPTT